MTTGPAPATSRDAFLGGRLVIEQPRDGGHRAGLDAIMLAAAVEARPGERLVDLGAGVGTAGLAAAARLPGIEAMLVEIDPMLAALAGANAAGNGLGDRVRVIVADIAAPAGAREAAGLTANLGDVVIVNPPFHEPGQVRHSPNAARERAHVLEAGLERWLRTATHVLKPGGRLVLIHRAEALADVLAVTAGRFGGLDVVPLYPRAGAAASRIIVTARKGSRAPLRLFGGLMLHEDGSSRYTAAADAVLCGAALRVAAPR
ncbi:MAG: methyltransferase [Hyphomicrobiales bacterium]